MLLASVYVNIEQSKLADVDAVRPRHLAAFKYVVVGASKVDNASGTDLLHSTFEQRALISVIGDNPDIVLESDTTGLANTPTATEFAARVRALLPLIVTVVILEAKGWNALPDRQRIAFVLACRRHAVPALQALDGGAA